MLRRRVLQFGAVLGGLVAILSGMNVSALSSDPKTFISADNTFYVYAKAGEVVNASILRVNQTEPFNTPQEDVTITLDAPGLTQQKCIAAKNVPVGQGCRFANVTAPETGVWRIQFAVPSTARTYEEVSPDVRWGKNLFNWNITVTSDGAEQKGRVWTERYAIRQPADESFKTDFNHYYISEDGYIYKATTRGYHGQISTLSADSVGIRSGDGCVSAYQSSEVSNTKLTPALGKCGSGYKLFFEEPSGNLPSKAKKWDGGEEWVRPNISRPSVAELTFNSDKSVDQQSGTISFYLRNFIGQYQVKIDVDNDGNFNGQDDVVLNQQMKRLSGGLQSVRFSGVDKTGQIISPSQQIGIRVEITKVAEIHFVATDVEGRTSGLELTRLNGENAPTTRLCWNDTELPTISEALMPKIIDGRECPDSAKGVHEWVYTDSSWGNARYIDDWIYASAKLEGNNTIRYPSETEAQTVTATRNFTLIWVITGLAVLLVAMLAIVFMRRKKHGHSSDVVSQPPVSTAQQPYERPNDSTQPPQG